MKKAIFLFLATCLFACTEVAYREPQPKGVAALTKIPAKLHGKYLMDSDTVYLFENGIKGKDKGKDEVFMFPNDTTVLKEYKGNYFVSWKDEDLWLLRILKIKKNGDILVLAIDVPMEKTEADLELNDTTSKATKVAQPVQPIIKSERDKFVEKLKKETPVTEDREHYVIDPSPKKLQRLVKKGFFKEVSVLKRIN